MESPREVVRRFCAAWSDNVATDDLAAFSSDDAVYHNIPAEPVVGIENIAEYIDSFISSAREAWMTTRPCSKSVGPSNRLRSLPK